ncbi:site-specific integrase [Thioclava litoralis]|uniref:Site-specific integrase n=1 Tax=Thioclava litoralis TaxID=3076557 RepID=A0ABZ1E056_9RHOB|nr:site-specific integrase [Thioclava sp. FTW29]
MERRRADGSVSYTAQVTKKKDGKIIYRKSQTFDRKAAANAWIKKKEAELATPAGLAQAVAKEADATTVGDLIERYTALYGGEIGRTKTQVLRSLLSHEIATAPANGLRSSQIIELAADLGKDKQPQTVLNYLSHLSGIFRVARPAWNVDIDQQVMRDAMDACKRMKLTSKSKKRERRPTVDEMDKIMAHFADKQIRRPKSIPMTKILIFALFSTRRQEEIVRLRWDDLEHGRVLVRDMKNPGDKVGNNIWCDLPIEAEVVARSMPRVDDRIFPFKSDTVSAAFTRACKFLHIEDLRFHDLRHEGVSRQFEMGKSIPQAASVSGHRSWTNLQRYSHLRQSGDRWAEWKWILD